MVKKNSEGSISINKAIPIIVLTWILALITALGLVYVAPSIFPPLGSANIADEAIITTKLSDGSVNSAKILDGSITALDLADGSIINIKIADGSITTEKIADGNVTNSKLAANSIPFNSTFGEDPVSTSSTSWVDMPNMTVNIDLARTSHLLIMFSGEVWLDAGGDYILVRALVNSTVAFPDSGELIVLTRAAQGNHGSNSFIFYLPNVSAGSHTVKIEWQVYTSGNVANVEARTLNVIALPA